MMMDAGFAPKSCDQENITLLWLKPSSNRKFEYIYGEHWDYQTKTYVEPRLDRRNGPYTFDKVYGAFKLMRYNRSGSSDSITDLVDAKNIGARNFKLLRSEYGTNGSDSALNCIIEYGESAINIFDAIKDGRVMSYEQWSQLCEERNRENRKRKKKRTSSI
jgi:hypothetical protein